jgi:hypothetical protein
MPLRTADRLIFFSAKHADWPAVTWSHTPTAAAVEATVSVRAPADAASGHAPAQTPCLNDVDALAVHRLDLHGRKAAGRVGPQQKRVVGLHGAGHQCA